VLPGADVTIRTVPRQVLGESIFDRIRGVAALNNVTLHDLSVEQEEGGLRVEQHIEVAESLPLVEAHRFVCELEEQMYRAAPEITNILTHIESEPATIEASATIEQDRRLEDDLRRVARALPEIIDIHEVAVSRMGGDRLHLSCHCTLPDNLPMQRVHEVITSLEVRLKLKRPEVYRMLVHPEPQADNRHEGRRCNRTESPNMEDTNDREGGVAARSGLRSHIG
jgi:divalent metal cation (Fe/Co/Zn/Cd) transporter